MFALVRDLLYVSYWDMEMKAVKPAERENLRSNQVVIQYATTRNGVNSPGFLDCNGPNNGFLLNLGKRTNGSMFHSLLCQHGVMVS